VEGVTPAIRFRDIAAAVALYTGPLGFEVVSGTVDQGHVAVARGESRLMLEGAGGFFGKEYNGAIADRLGTPSAGALYVQADDIDDVLAAAQAAGLHVVDPLAERAWGQEEFTVEDAEGNWLTFWKRLP
jgi:catechol 2,3-dioxygenase-like lactoylglutathione lyase family enzyme